MSRNITIATGTVEPEILKTLNLADVLDLIRMNLPKARVVIYNLRVDGVTIKGSIGRRPTIKVPNRAEHN